MVSDKIFLKNARGKMKINYLYFLLNVKRIKNLNLRYDITLLQVALTLYVSRFTGISEKNNLFNSRVQTKHGEKYSKVNICTNFIFTAFHKK